MAERPEKRSFEDVDHCLGEFHMNFKRKNFKDVMFAREVMEEMMFKPGFVAAMVESIRTKCVSADEIVQNLLPYFYKGIDSLGWWEICLIDDDELLVRYLRSKSAGIACFYSNQIKQKFFWMQEFVANDDKWHNEGKTIYLMMYLLNKRPLITAWMKNNADLLNNWLVSWTDIFWASNADVLDMKIKRATVYLKFYLVFSRDTFNVLYSKMDLNGLDSYAFFTMEELKRMTGELLKPLFENPMPNQLNQKRRPMSPIYAYELNNEKRYYDVVYNTFYHDIVNKKKIDEIVISRPSNKPLIFDRTFFNRRKH